MGILALIQFLILLFVHSRQQEWTYRLDYLWKTQAADEKLEMMELQNNNRQILCNLLPAHVAAHFISSNYRSNMELYSQAYSRVGVFFGSIPNFSEFYMELDANNQGVECLRVLNEIIADFDELLNEDRFQGVDKIKTIGSTFMAAVGLTPDNVIQDTDESVLQCMTVLVEFILAMRERLAIINENSYNNFMLRIGVNVGPVVAGVIGARKPQYDIWGNTVNVASRMDSTGKLDYVQTTEEVYRILKDRYDFQCRGTINVKGKGFMTTYFLLRRKASTSFSDFSLHGGSFPRSPISHTSIRSSSSGGNFALKSPEKASMESLPTVPRTGSDVLLATQGKRPSCDSVKNICQTPPGSISGWGRRNNPGECSTPRDTMKSSKRKGSNSSLASFLANEAQCSTTKVTGSPELPMVHFKNINFYPTQNGNQSTSFADSSQAEYMQANNLMQGDRPQQLPVGIFGNRTGLLNNEVKNFKFIGSKTVGSPTRPLPPLPPGQLRNPTNQMSPSSRAPLCRQLSDSGAQAQQRAAVPPVVKQHSLDSAQFLKNKNLKPHLLDVSDAPAYNKPRSPIQTKIKSPEHKYRESALRKPVFPEVMPTSPEHKYKSPECTKPLFTDCHITENRKFSHPELEQYRKPQVPLHIEERAQTLQHVSRVSSPKYALGFINPLSPTNLNPSPHDSIDEIVRYSPQSPIKSPINGSPVKTPKLLTPDLGFIKEMSSPESEMHTPVTPVRESSAPVLAVIDGLQMSIPERSPSPDLLEKLEPENNRTSVMTIDTDVTYDTDVGDTDFGETDIGDTDCESNVRTDYDNYSNSNCGFSDIEDMPRDWNYPDVESSAVDDFSDDALRDDDFDQALISLQPVSYDIGIGPITLRDLKLSNHSPANGAEADIAARPKNKPSSNTGQSSPRKKDSFKIPDPIRKQEMSFVQTLNQMTEAGPSAGVKRPSVGSGSGKPDSYEYNGTSEENGDVFDASRESSCEPQQACAMNSLPQSCQKSSSGSNKSDTPQTTTMGSRQTGGSSCKAEGGKPRPHPPPFQVKRRQKFAPPPRHCRSLDYIPSDADDGQSSVASSANPSPKLPRTSLNIPPQLRQYLLQPDNISLSSFGSCSELSRSDPALNYDSSSAAYESEYDNYRPGMTSDDEFFTPGKISDVDIDYFDDVDLESVGVSECYSFDYTVPSVPQLNGKKVTDV